MVLNNPRKSPMSIKTGSYTGDAGDDRQITTGFKCSLVVLINADYTVCAILIPGISYAVKTTPILLAGGTALHATDGFTVYHTTDLMNAGTKAYYYWAIATA
ncbi:hypothetical protein ES705_36269 [subsurface metagenome]